MMQQRNSRAIRQLQRIVAIAACAAYHFDRRLRMIVCLPGSVVVIKSRALIVTQLCDDVLLAFSGTTQIGACAVLVQAMIEMAQKLGPGIIKACDQHLAILPVTC